MHSLIEWASAAVATRMKRNRDAAMGPTTPRVSLLSLSLPAHDEGQAAAHPFPRLFHLVQGDGEESKVLGGITPLAKKG